jgi:methyl-accepting chemotaxis protein
MTSTRFPEGIFYHNRGERNMKIQAKKFFWKLEFKQNLITYCLALPLALYVAIVCGDVLGDKLFAIFMGILISAGPVLVLGTFWNYMRLRKPLAIIFDENSTIEQINLAREALLREPNKQALSIVIRWIINPTLAVVIGNVFVPMDPIQYFAILVVVLVTVPSGYVYSYFIGEKELSLLLKSSHSAAEINDFSNTFSLTKKIIISLFTMAWSPMVTFGFIILEMNMNLVHFENISLHIAIIMALLFIVLLYITYIFTSSVRMTLNLTREGINQLVDGNLNIRIPLVTRDEMSEMNGHLNNLIAVLNKIISGIEEESKNLNHDSRGLSDTISMLSDNTRDVASSVEEMSASIEELAASSENIAVNSKEQNRQMTQVSTLMHKILSNADTISEMASSGADISKVTEQKAVEGGVILGDTVSKIENIQKSTHSISDSASIIKDIADQVNLLSLNASIEAARAGEYGKGFSVVAEEISKLADSTQKNADQISKSIETTLLDVKNGIASIKTTTEKFNEIISFVKKTVAIVIDIARESRSQYAISEEIQKHFNDMINTTEANLRATEEQALTHQEYIDSVSRISESIQNIAKRAMAVNDLSKVLDSRADTLSKEIEFFSLSSAPVQATGVS